MRPARIRDKKMMEYKNLSLEELLIHKTDSAAWYWLGMAYWEHNDFRDAAEWLNKTMNDPNNEWADKAAQNLGILHLGLIPNASRDEALRLFEKSIHLLVSKLHAGFLYYEGTESNPEPDGGMRYKGIRIIEEVIQHLKETNGNDDYLKADECFKIGLMYAESGYPTDAKEYLKKAIDRADHNYISDRRLIEIAEEVLKDLNL